MLASAPDGQPNDLELMRLHVNALYTRDPRGRLDRVNVSDGEPAPRFFLGRPRYGNEWWFRHDVDDALARELGTLAASDAVNDDLRTSTVGAERYEALLARFLCTAHRGRTLRRRPLRGRSVWSASEAICISPDATAKTCG